MLEELVREIITNFHNNKANQNMILKELTFPMPNIPEQSLFICIFYSVSQLNFPAVQRKKGVL